MIKVDACGTVCPQPLLLTKKAISKSTKEVEIIVDDNTAKINVTKYLEHQGFTVEIEDCFEYYVIKATR